MLQMRIFLFLLLENCQQTKPMFFFWGVVNQHQPNRSSKKIAISWGVGGGNKPNISTHRTSTHLSTHLRFPGRKRFKSWKLFKVVVAALPKSRKPNAWRRQQLRLWPGNGWGTGTGVGVGELERNGVGEPTLCGVLFEDIWNIQNYNQY